MCNTISEQWNKQKRHSTKKTRGRMEFIIHYSLQNKLAHRKTEHVKFVCLQIDFEFKLDIIMLIIHQVVVDTFAHEHFRCESTQYSWKMNATRNYVMDSEYENLILN